MKRFLVLGAALAATSFSLFGVAPAAVGAPSPGGLPIIRDQGRTTGQASGLPTTSINWSGYAVAAQAPFTDVSSEWVQPAITCSGNEKYVITSNWVGLDGFNDQTVEQDGTDAKCAAPTNTPKYEAWYEMYPAGSVNVFGVQPGDTISASVSYQSGEFTLTIADLTSHQTNTKVSACSTCERNSAEWIIERAAFCGNPTCTTAVIGALPDFGKTTMTDDVASAGGVTAGINGFASNYPIEGVYNLNDTEKIGPKGFISVDTVSNVTPTNSFTATWDRSGKPTPIKL
jgi:hypothetical protein